MDYDRIANELELEAKRIAAPLPCTSVRRGAASSHPDNRRFYKWVCKHNVSSNKSPSIIDLYGPRAWWLKNNIPCHHAKSSAAIKAFESRRTYFRISRLRELAADCRALSRKQARERWRSYSQTKEEWADEIERGILHRVARMGLMEYAKRLGLNQTTISKCVEECGLRQWPLRGSVEERVPRYFAELFLCEVYRRLILKNLRDRIA